MDSQVSEGNHLDDQPLFHTFTKYTFEEYKRYNDFYLKKRMNRLMIPIVLVGLIGVAEIFLKRYIYGGFFLIFTFGYPFLLKFLLSRRIKKLWESGKRFQNRVNQIDFYEDRIRTSSEENVVFYTYDTLYKIMETDTNFYLFVSMNQAILLVKENCSPELMTFIRDLQAKMPKK